MKELSSVSVPTVRRLPLYMAILKEISPSSEFVSSTLIADRLGLEQIQVRKDLAGIGVTGQPAVGFNIQELIAAIEQLLGWDNIRDAILLGAGNLGQALLGYDGFARHGLNIVAAFDMDPEKIGMRIHGKTVFDIDHLASLTERMHIQIGILTVPGKYAQSAADSLILAGIHAIWNFTPAKLTVPGQVIVEQVDLAASLAVLSSKLKAANK